MIPINEPDGIIDRSDVNQRAPPDRIIATRDLGLELLFPPDNCVSAPDAHLRRSASVQTEPRSAKLTRVAADE